MAEVTKADLDDLRRMLRIILGVLSRTGSDVGAVMTTSTDLTAAVTALTESQTAITALLESLLEGKSTQEEALAELRAIRQGMDLIVEEL